VVDPPNVELQVCGVLATPLPEVAHTLEPLARLRELEHSVVVVDLMRDVLISA
jgi:hypothetical protein